ncbi:NAD+ synthase [Thermoproteus tenax]|uniref:NH(3)-dependent NAD(+) synthetase n=1 Tax=Thermoproteus tenax (strain ATCC 35583 / DSM 2078 / JCM 9277 / NBRC 100435 / Kra 1) TaxID=768679 RepID=G4RK23_THETK|nr:NAD+ synthase [Thermoproteus tenax]CCC81918.1 NH(3)-dependent NAD+ synthetase [Thermoproteus tenax Kra 1]
MITLADVISAINYSRAKDEITNFIARYISEARVKGAVVGVSGGVDSCTTLALTAEALGPRKVTALVLPSGFTPRQDVEDAVALAKRLGVRHYVISIDQLLSAFSYLPIYDENDAVARGNLMARIRMAVLYYYANKNNLLVVGTGDKSELMLGYFTKYGDGGVDILPIGDLYKTQVREMAKFLGLPESIALKPSAPRLWAGHTAEGELGLKYGEVDLVLYAYELGIPKEDIPRETGVSKTKVETILRRVRQNAHKRAPPPVAQLDKAKQYVVRRSF